MFWSRKFPVKVALWCGIGVGGRSLNSTGENGKSMTFPRFDGVSNAGEFIDMFNERLIDDKHSTASSFL